MSESICKTCLNVCVTTTEEYNLQFTERENEPETIPTKLFYCTILHRDVWRDPDVLPLKGRIIPITECSHRRPRSLGSLTARTGFSG